VPPAADESPIDALLARTQKSAAIDPLCAAQVALARNGELLAFESFGCARFGAAGGVEHDATNDTLFSVYSVTKAIVSAASWLLLEQGKLALEERVVDRIPEFGRHGKQDVTVEQLLIHTAGFPTARMPTRAWEDPIRRVEHMAEWRLEWPPGSRFVYHGAATMWVLAELITRSSGLDYRDFIRTRILEPLRLANLYIGLPESEQGRVADVVCIGEEMTSEQRGASPVDAPVIGDDLLEEANAPENRAIGTPGGGAIASAADIALFYQGLLADEAGRGAGLWRPETLRDAWSVRHPELIDDMTNQPATRGLGVVVAGESGKMWRGFAEDCSPRAFGHMGAGGQVAWADPETGLSFAFLTNGAQRNAARQGANGFRLSTLAAACVPRG
jgi:CubicO group peptidase (beta-lactamase class C family)